MINNYKTKLKDLQHNGSLRTLKNLGSRDGNHINYEGKRLLNLSSNDYLGLATDKTLLESFYSKRTESNLLDEYGLGSSSSRLLTGNSNVCSILEEELASQYGKNKSALLFNSGYHANIGLLPALADRNDLILADKFCHASIIDGIRLSKAKLIRFRHLDYDHLEKLLSENQSPAPLYPSSNRQVFIVTESIFSMDGDLADIPKLVKLKNDFNAYLYVDEAHAVGVRGSRGLGICEETGLINDVDIILGTFGKALASQGAFAIVAPVIRDYLINTARSLIFTTALPPITANWNLHVLKHVSAQSKLRDKLAALSNKLCKALQNAGVDSKSKSHIIPIVVGDDKSAVKLADRLVSAGFLVFPIRPPTVPKGSSRIRLSISATMKWEEIEPIIKTIKSIKHHRLNEITLDKTSK